MSNDPRGVTRNQLAEFLPNQRLVRTMEQLLKQVNTLLPDEIATINRLIQEAYVEASTGTSRGQLALDQIGELKEDLLISLGTADAKAAQSLEALTSIAKSLELLAVSPVQQSVTTSTEVLPPGLYVSLNELADASVKLPSSGNLLVYDATLKVWKNALLTAGANLTIVNADGSITLSASGTAGDTHAAASKATPVDADEIPLADSASSFSLKKLTWANLKATAKTYFDTLYLGILATAANSSQLLGSTWAAPAAIGTTTRANGNFLVNDSNLFVTAAGTTASTPSGTPVTIYTLPNIPDGTWLVTASVPGASDAAYYNASSIVHSSNASTKAIALATATGMAISVSGLNLQTTQASGISIAMHWSILRLS